MSASSITIAGFLPPISSETRAWRSAAFEAMAAPVSEEPVNEIACTSGWSTMAWPVTPAPCTRLTTPGGTPASCITWTSSIPEWGASSLGLNTTVLPLRMAGNIFHVGTATGKFQAVISPHTPIGRRTVMLNLSFISDGTVWPKSWRPIVMA